MVSRTFVLAAFVAAIGAGAAGATIFRQSAPVTGAVRMAQGPARAIEQVFLPDPVSLFGKDHLRVLLVGLDYDYDKLDQETSKSARSDVIMAVDLDLKAHRVNELSIPRDMIATLPNGRKAKINQAQSDGGIAEAKSVIAGFLGIPAFDRYVVMRINTSKDVIDAVGGIDVNVQNANALKHAGPNGPVDYDDNWGHLHVHLRPGLHHLSGGDAVGYARFRHDWCSDPCRIMRQQQVIRATIARIEEDKLNTLEHTKSLFDTVRRDVETDFSTREELATAMAFSHVSPRDVRTAQVPYTGSVQLPDYGDSIVADDAEKARLVAAMFPPSRTAEELAAEPAPSPAAIRVRIENGTAVPGLAAKTAAALRRQGFRISGVGNAAVNDLAVTQVRSDPGKSAESARVLQALGLRPGDTTAGPAATDLAVPGEASDVTIVLGRDVVNVP